MINILPSIVYFVVVGSLSLHDDSFGNDCFFLYFLIHFQKKKVVKNRLSKIEKKKVVKNRLSRF